MFVIEEISSAVRLFDGNPPFLADLVKRYRVCWEAWPEYSTIGGQERQTGFELELSGTHESASRHIGRGCPACRQIYRALRALTEWALPGQAQRSMYQIGPYEALLRYSAAHGCAPNGILTAKIDVALRVKVLQLKGFDESAGRGEMRSLRETKENLSELGSGERQWSLARPRCDGSVREQQLGPRQCGRALTSSRLGPSMISAKYVSLQDK